VTKALALLFVAALAAAPRRATKTQVALKPRMVAIGVDPDNPHYLRFRGNTTVLIGSTEHYGAILNMAFDIPKYLDAVREAGLNLVRIFNGAYVETLDSAVFEGADQNTLAPRPGQYLAPWMRSPRSAQPGYSSGGNKFDLSRWDDAYFERLHSFISEAGKRNIAVEVTLFSVLYGNGSKGWGSWNLNPLNAMNNVNGFSKAAWDRFNTLEDPKLTGAQDALVRKTAAAIDDLDNFYYEICNECYFSGAGALETAAWVRHIAATLASAEATLPLHHAIAENVANGYAAIESPDPAVSIWNFHYASPPSALAINWALNKPIAFDETSNGCTSLDRRREAWAFALSGGAVYDNLDASFKTDNAAGTDSPGCQETRYELRTLANFVSGLDLKRMRPAREELRQWPLFSSEGYMLKDPDNTWAIYLKGGSNMRISTLLLELPAGRFQTEWLNPRTGDSEHQAAVDHPGGVLKLQTPAYSEDLAIKLTRVAEPAKPAPKPLSKPAPGTYKK
jgi:hypothetical protein